MRFSFAKIGSHRLRFLKSKSSRPCLDGRPIGILRLILQTIRHKLLAKLALQCFLFSLLAALDHFFLLLGKFLFSVINFLGQSLLPEFLTLIAVKILSRSFFAAVRHLILLSGEMFGSVFCDGRIHAYGKTQERGNQNQTFHNQSLKRLQRS